jgi:hypothetical protein
MKINHLLATLAVTAFAAMNVMATDALLSPRAAELQVQTAPHSANDPDLTAIHLSSAPPRLADNQIETVSGKDDSVNPSSLCARRMSGTPKMIDSCAQHPGAAMPCCSVAAGK